MATTNGTTLKVERTLSIIGCGENAREVEIWIRLTFY
jgi:hypothetical protein